MRINGFEQIKGFYSWVFDNQDKNIKPQHMSLYMFIINQNNRNSWIEWFKMPFDLAMAGSGISSKKTYYSCLADLQEWKLIKYEKGVNNWKAPLIKVEVLKDTATVPQSEPQLEQADEPQGIPQTVPQSEPQPTPNIKPITSNLKPDVDDKEENPPSAPAFNFFTIHDFEKTIQIGENEFTLLAARKTKKTVTELTDLLPVFIAEQKALTKVTWRDQPDAKQHFMNWANKQASKTRKLTT